MPSTVNSVFEAQETLRNPQMEGPGTETRIELEAPRGQSRTEDVGNSDLPLDKQRWNEPKSNIAKVSVTYYSFILLGANDSSYGVSIMSICCWPDPYLFDLTEYLFSPRTGSTTTRECHSKSMLQWSNSPHHRACFTDLDWAHAQA